MKRILFLTIIIIAIQGIASQLIAQSQRLELINTETGRIKHFKKNKKITVYTKDGMKIKGHLGIIDDQNIEIKGITIPLDSIERIKNKSIIVRILSAIGIVEGSLFTIISPLFNDNQNEVLITGLALLGSGIGATQIRANFYSINNTIRISNH